MVCKAACHCPHADRTRVAKQKSHARGNCNTGREIEKSSLKMSREERRVFVFHPWLRLQGEEKRIWGEERRKRS